jgi:hypothetical protein
MLVETKNQYSINFQNEGNDINIVVSPESDEPVEELMNISLLKLFLGSKSDYRSPDRTKELLFSLDSICNVLEEKIRDTEYKELMKKDHLNKVLSDSTSF